MGKISFDIGTAFFGEDNHFLSQFTDIGTLVSILLSNAIVVAGIFLVFIIVISGMNMISGSGDVQKIDQARQVLTAGIIGFVVVVIAFFIVRLVESSLGINILG
jgi:hypothetical protein